jgi:hypothetical protein
MDTLGYVIDLESKLVSISNENFLSAVYGMITIDLDKKVSLKMAEAGRLGKSTLESL